MLTPSNGFATCLSEDLLDVKQVLERLMIDPILLCDVIYCVCKPQADAEKISDVDFAQAMAGDSIAHAKTALVEELVNISPDPRDRENLGKAIEKFNADGRSGAGSDQDPVGQPDAESRDRGGAERRWRIVWELAGIVGVDPGPLTLRELVWLAEARQREAWSHTSQILAMLYNSHRGKAARAMKPAEFNPFVEKNNKPLGKTSDLSILKQVFIDR